MFSNLKKLARPDDEDNHSVEALRKRRRSWLAAILAMLCPGLGHLYVGRPRLATAIALVPTIAWIIAVVIGAYHPRSLCMITFTGLGVYIAIWISQVVSAVILSRREGYAYLLRRYNRLLIYLGFLVGTSIATKVPANLIRAYIVEPFRIPSAGMLPTLVQGDQIFVAKVGEAANRRRGDVVVFKNPVNEEVDFIKRVVGIPGDRIRIANERVYVNGEEQPRRLVESAYAYSWQDSGGQEVMEKGQLYDENLSGHSHLLLQSRSTCQNPGNPQCNYRQGQEFIVPEGHFFVMGDNRDNSADSRFGFGGRPGTLVFVPSGNIKGKAAVVWLSLSHSLDIRWDRIGQLL